MSWRPTWAFCVQACAAGVLVLGASSPALANPRVDRAAGLAEEAAFPEALALLAQAEAEDSLTRSDVVELLRVRATVHFAMGETDELTADLVRLLSLDPEYSLGPRVPPALREALEAARPRVSAPLELHVTADAGAAGTTIRARVSGDPEGLVRRVEIGGRAEGGRWVTSSEGRLTVPGVNVAYHVEAIGMGDAVLVNHGSEAEPVFASDGAQGGGAVAATGDDPVPVVLGIVIPVVVIGAVAIVLAIVLGSGQSTNAVFAPRFE